MKKHIPKNQRKTIKTAKGRKISSSLWLQRQLTDQYVHAAKKEGYRSRAAYKLIEINEKHKLLNNAKNILDLGAAPGSWSQVARKLCKNANIVAIDLQEIDSITGVDFIHGDFFDLEKQKILAENLPEKADVILSDMAPASCGHASTDHLRIIALAEEVLEFCKENLAHNGSLLIKLLKGEEEQKFVKNLKDFFKEVKYIKPDSSRKDSREMFVIAKDFSL